MFDKFKDLAEKAKESISAAADLVGDFAEREDVRAATEGLKKTAISASSEAARFCKEAAQSDLAKDAGAGAAVGAVMAVPVPIVGPVIGATAGATLGIYKNLTRNEQPSVAFTADQNKQVDLYSEMLKIEDLRKRGIISDDEFSSMKRNLLSSH
ncbi:MAG: hypothetical protein WBB01_08875 [Phormidesmis sp.]